MGAVTPVGLNPEETWNNLLAGKSGAAPITNFDPFKFKTQFACEVKGFDVTQYIDRKEARKIDRYSQFALASAIASWFRSQAGTWSKWAMRPPIPGPAIT